MNKFVFSLFVVMFSTVAIQAQQISVVSEDGATTIYQELDDAISGATAGSTIYLPGGGFKHSDGIKIQKKLTIVGIGHKANSDNVDANTMITGNLYFNEGSDDSAIMGCYLSGNVIIGDNYARVNNVLVKYCNLLSVQVKYQFCSGTIVNQNYIRSTSNFSGAEGHFSNNIAHSLQGLNGGRIDHNLFTSYVLVDRGITHVLNGCDNSTISNNVFLSSVFEKAPTGCLVSNNMSKVKWGDEPIEINDEWVNVFENYNDGNITPSSIFHFTDYYKKYENQCGIYGGTGFKDSGMAPVPFIVSKVIPEQTDAEGKLNIKIRVKASE